MLPVFLRLHILFGFNDEPTVCRRNIPGSWGFNWNWYVCYSNSEIPRSKGICCSSCHHYSTSSHGTNSLSSHVFDHFLQPETRKNLLFVRIFEQMCASITRLKTLLLGWRKQEGKVLMLYWIILEGPTFRETWIV